jgi:hypothetical protein
MVDFVMLEGSKTTSHAVVGMADGVQSAAAVQYYLKSL